MISLKCHTFNYNGRFNKAKAKQVAQAKRALFGLIAKDLTQIEQVQTYFCKQILQLPKSTANCMVLCELGRTPLEVQIIKRVLDFLIKLATGKKASCPQ